MDSPSPRALGSPSGAGVSSGGAVPDRCPACGEPINPRAPWCDGCGARLDDAPPLGDAVAREGRPVPATADPTPARAPFPVDLGAYRRKLSDVFGYPDFRGGQAAVLRALPERDVVAVMPTGTGKSICYVLPALEVGRTVVVSPLIALMQDQVESLQAAGVAATFINSHIDREEQNRRYLAFVRGQVPLLYVAPERFRNPRFTVGLRNAGVNLLAVDEAHCISEWGHNFRPDYLQLGAVRERLGFPRTLALTATANPQVRRDIAQRLGIAMASAEVVTSVDRPNLTFAVEAIEAADDRRRWVVEYVRERPGLAGIVYVRTRRGVEEMAEALRNAGVKAEAYHAGLERGRRTLVQRRFMVGEVPVIVATNAFGMGVDKPDVRYVVHLNMPGRIEAYYQEAGRAGRDGDHAECTLLYARADRRFQQGFIEDAHPDATAVRATWRRWVALAEGDGHLPSTVGEEDPDRFAMTVAALRDSGLLDPVALRLTSTDPDAPIDVSGILRHRVHEEARLREMAEYAETNGCRRGLILRYFGEEPPERCEACDNCLGRHEQDEAPPYPPDLYDEVVAFREQLARATDRDPYLVFENRTARELATFRPASMDALRAVWGIGERRAGWFGQDLLRLIAEWEAGHPEAAPPAPNPAVQPSLGLRPGRATPTVEEDVRPDDPLYVALRAWRTARAKAEGAPAYTIFADRTLRDLVRLRPRNMHALLRVWGLGESRVERFGRELLEVIGTHGPRD